MTIAPFALLVVALIALFYARLIAPFSAPCASLFRIAAALLIALGALIGAALVVATCAVLNVTPQQIEAFRTRFLAALRAADISVTKASIYLYGHEDHARLNKELAEGT